MKKRIAAFVLTIAMTAQMALSAFADTDDYVFTDEPQNTYIGRTEAADIIRNINFTDVSADHYARESVMQNGALNFVKGYSGTYMPNNPVSRQEALAFLLRTMGRENDAINLAPNLQATMPEGSSLRTLWSIGYLSLAREIGMISYADYEAALVEDQSTLEPGRFRRSEGATRQEVAQWVYRAMRAINPTAFQSNASMQSIYQFSDWESISPEHVVAVEALVSNGVMQGSGGRFQPRSTITRAEMSLLLQNIDSIYFNITGIEKVTGVVSGIRDNQRNQGSDAMLWRNYFIRNANGTLDIIQFPYEVSASPQSIYMDVPVYRNGQISGLSELQEGDQVEYLVREATNEVLYLRVMGETVRSEVSGLLYEVDASERTINITDSSGRHFIYPLASGLVNPTNNTIRIENVDRDIAALPYGSRYNLSLVNSVVTGIVYVGEPTIINEIRGIVVENNEAFSYLTILNNDGQEVTYEYYSNDMIVEKQQHYDTDDEVGYLDEVFPFYRYDPSDTVISQIEVGDIVFIRTNPDNPSQITSIRAATNYIMKYGKLISFAFDGDLAQILIEYENKQTAWFEVPAGIHLSKDGRPVTMATVKVGDWVKLLVNQAIIQPGYIIESVKEMTIEGDEHFISTLIKGQLAGVNAIQNQLLVQNAQVLTKTGWDQHRQLDQFSLDGRDVEIYNGDQRISLDYALQYLKRATGEVYIALENNFTGERIRKVTFRPGRDEVLLPDTVISSNGSGGFMILSNTGMIETDAGTIVRRHGRLVDGKDIMVPDYATVILNGQNRAAVVDIGDAPDTSALSIVRGRIQSVDQGRSFTVQSMAALMGVDWIYTPVQREFTIDYNTLFLNDGGAFVSANDFLDYGDVSVLDRVYTIVVDGSRAARVIEAPYANNAIRGLIYSVQGSIISIRNAHYYNRTTGAWMPVSHENNIATIAVNEHTLIARNNTFIRVEDLQQGEQIRMMIVDAMPPPETSQNETTLAVDGYIGFIEN